MTPRLAYHLFDRGRFISSFLDIPEVIAYIKERYGLTTLHEANEWGLFIKVKP